MQKSAAPSAAEAYTLYGATISNVRIEDDQLKFDVDM